MNKTVTKYQKQINEKKTILVTLLTILILTSCASQPRLEKQVVSVTEKQNRILRHLKKERRKNLVSGRINSDPKLKAAERRLFKVIRSLIRSNRALQNRAKKTQKKGEA